MRVGAFIYTLCPIIWFLTFYVDAHGIPRAACHTSKYHTNSIQGKRLVHHRKVSDLERLGHKNRVRIAGDDRQPSSWVHSTRQTTGRFSGSWG